LREEVERYKRAIESLDGPSLTEEPGSPEESPESPESGGAAFTSVAVAIFYRGLIYISL